ncbi:MAG: hypothetical protein KDD45_13230, partial [Bdellovibrionales bacterium]|nr:hypothetical protein [Bdellovibrionales bacterium]
MKDIVLRLQRQLEEKDRVDKEQCNTIKKLSKMCDELKKELNEKGEVIRKLEERITKLEKMPEKMPPNQRMSGGSKYLPIE